MNKNTIFKAFALVIILAALLLPMAGKAQSYNDATAESQNRDAFYELIAYETYLDELANVIKISEFNNRSGETFSISNDDFGAPLGSGVGILLAAGAGYAVVRRKRSRKNTTLLLACVLLLGFTQCKKEQIEPQGGKVSITLNVENGGKAIDGAKVNVNPNSSPMVTFGSGDKILVAYDGTYVGYLEHNGSNFSGDIYASGDNTKPLYFYFLGNCVDVSGLSAGTTTSCTANISDQTAYPALPVISFSASDQNFNGAGSYTASLHNKASLMKFNVTTPSNSPICITGMNNKVTVNFADRSTNDGFSYSKESGGVIKLKGGSGSNVEKWAIVLQQDALDAGAEGSAYTEDFYVGARPAIPAITMDQFLNEDRAMTVNTLAWDGDLSKVTSSSTEAFATARDGMTISGTLVVNKKISIADGATVTLSDVYINGSGTWSSGDYAGLNCLSDATIILADGTTNTVRGFYQEYPGIYIPSGYTLTIQGTGALNASSNGYGAGIGAGLPNDLFCGNIIINSGTITATGGSLSAGIGSSKRSSCGNITITGGTITATGGGSGAGIGGGGYYDGALSSCGDITISGGTVTATGGEGGAGIGSGNGYDGSSSCGNIIISGGTVEATGGDYASGIGCGVDASCGVITINGGSVTATGGENAAGIGSGSDSSCGNITINSGTVTANGGIRGAGIGTGANASCETITINGGSVTATGGVKAAGIGSGFHQSSCGAINISGGTVEATGGENAAGIGSGYGYVDNSSCGAITIETTVTRVTATKGSSAPNSIGAGNSGTCGTVKFGNATVYSGSAWSPNPMVAGNYGGLSLAITTTTNTNDTWTLTPAPPVPSIPEGAINGKFTINGSGDQVYFSQGNLQAVGTTSSSPSSGWTWQFAEHQYDYIGGRSNGGSGDLTGNNYINGNGSVSTAGAVDLFSWSTNATYYGIHNSDDAATYSGTFRDWGNNITGWRTLTKAEWVWVLGPSEDTPNPGNNCRTSSTVNGVENARYAKATVVGKAGLIIFPDSYTHPGGVTAPENVNTADAAYNSNSYDATAWGKMEAAGAVFLPAAGIRPAGINNYVLGCEVTGGYWSSVPLDDQNAYFLLFQPIEVTPSGYNPRNTGCSVRLVKDAN